MFLNYDKGDWTDITKDVFPVTPYSDIGYFKLPRIGTTVELICGDELGDDSRPGQKLAEFKWNKTRFVKL